MTEADGRSPANAADDAKRLVAEAAAMLVEDGMRLGLGSGSTALLFIDALGRRMAHGLTVAIAVPTSQATEARARAAGIPLAGMDGADAPDSLDLAVDGADELTAELALLKGGGACLTREKIVAAMARRFVVIGDGSKVVARLGRFPLPVEVVPFGWSVTRTAIARRFGIEPTLRMAGVAPLVTDNGNFIIDCPFGAIDDPAMVAAALAALPGIVEHGLFLGMADEALIARNGGVERMVSAIPGQAGADT